MPKNVCLKWEQKQLSDIDIVFETFIKIPQYLCTNKFLINICGGKDAFYGIFLPVSL